MDLNKLYTEDQQEKNSINLMDARLDYQGERGCMLSVVGKTPITVCSNGEVYSFDELPVPTAGIGDTPRPEIQNSCLLSVPGIKRLARNEPVDGVSMFGRLGAQCRRFIGLPSDALYHILALFVIVSHLIPMCLTRPFLFLLGEPGSGKSTLERFLSVVCFHAMRISGHSIAALRRAIGAHRGTIVIDEAEELSAAGETNLKKLLRNTFTANEVDIRCEKGMDDNWRLTKQKVEAGPIVLANISGIRDEALLSRCITIQMVECPNYAKAPVASPDDPELMAVSDDVKIWALQNFRRVRECYARMENTGGLSGRQFDVYRPLLAVAEAIGGQEMLAQTWSDIQTLRHASRESAVKFDRDLHLLEVIQGITADGDTKIRNSDLVTQITQRTGERINASDVADFVRRHNLHSKESKPKGYVTFELSPERVQLAIEQRRSRIA